jgi:probable HAF family extracellular repeat protein
LRCNPAPPTSLTTTPREAEPPRNTRERRTGSSTRAASDVRGFCSIFLGAERWTGSAAKVLGPSAIHGYGLNDVGDVVGETGSPHAYLFTNDQIVDLGAALGGGPSTALDLNNDGVIVGAIHAYALPRPFIYQSQAAGAPLVLDPIGGDTWAVATSLNQSGDVVGLSGTGDWKQERNGFVWRATTNAVQNLGQLWEMWSLSGSGLATGMKHFGGPKTSGGYTIGSAFRLDVSADPLTFEDLGHSTAGGYAASVGKGINDAGVVVGNSIPDYASGSTQHWRAFVHFPAGSTDAGFHDLHDLVAGGADWELSIATAINNSGVIVGWGDYQGKMRGFRLTPRSADSEDEAPYPVEV